MVSTSSSSSSSSSSKTLPHRPIHVTPLSSSPLVRERERERKRNSSSSPRGKLHPSGNKGNNNNSSNVLPPERNQLNLARIEDGQDTRTTVMIKNIPNKMGDKDLMAYIGKVCPRKIDFMYLRMDFQNGACHTCLRVIFLCSFFLGCNVGYAFVNFIYVQDLLAFAKARLGVKWCVIIIILLLLFWWLILLQEYVL